MEVTSASLNLRPFMVPPKDRVGIDLINNVFEVLHVIDEETEAQRN